MGVVMATYFAPLPGGVAVAPEDAPAGMYDHFCHVDRVSRQAHRQQVARVVGTRGAPVSGPGKALLAQGRWLNRRNERLGSILPPRVGPPGGIRTTP